MLDVIAEPGSDFGKVSFCSVCLFVCCSLLTRHQKKKKKKKAHVVFALRRMCKTTQAREAVARLFGVAPLLEHFFALQVQPLQKSLAGLLQTLATNPEIKVPFFFDKEKLLVFIYKTIGSNG